MKYLLCVLLLGVFLYSACGSNDNLSFCEEEMLPTLQEYIDTNMLNVTPGADNSFSYLILEAGDGERPQPNSMVTVNYVGMKTNGDIFDQTTGNPRTFSLSGLIRGWQLGIPLVGAGGRIQLFLPPEVAYGTRGVPGSICPNTPLVFEIELVSFTQ
ncbi:FKBP-type peptidyl-prolyl cis-trans isomerase [Lewinella sp. 4G2]|uniref:FKBP-type peptidyl-prolyl cis-trans isomerase n=1 Tax=Lewinella sp. 4G2 TaxID=1803372 RepID=UPI0007B4CEAF|nr:FKBP-type peptidyl-prolyl cis-trans isomerase [Lewinella sp. 4G2]OAV43046.1 hypothetical protein A3850_000380 [Lewinella sp. 4G2]